MLNSVPLPWDTLRAVGPTRLVSYRPSRFSGDAVAVELRAFAAEDQALLLRCYEALRAIRSALEGTLQSAALPADALASLGALLRRLGWRDLVRALQRFGGASLAWHETPLLAAVIHDLRGGSFVALVVGLDLLQFPDSSPADWRRALFLARDHLKIMRNAVRDLDAGGWARDMQPAAHSVRLLLEKWHQARHALADGSVDVVVECHFGGDVADRCLEFAALDRVLYNLIGNAARFAADRVVYLAIFPLDDHDVRFVIVNRMPAEQRALLAARFGDTLSDLFAGGFTVGGNGLGMRICAEFIAEDYGLRSPEQAAAEGYVGARRIDDLFVAWFHWPIGSVAVERSAAAT